MASAAAATAAATAASLLLISPGAAMAETSWPLSFTGDYTDPLHPGCERHIEVEPVAKDGVFIAHYTGTAVPPPPPTPPPPLAPPLAPGRTAAAARAANAARDLQLHHHSHRYYSTCM